MSHYIINLSYIYITSFITQQLRGIHDPTLVVNNSHQETTDDNVINIEAVVSKNKIQRCLLLLLLSSHSLHLMRANPKELWLKYKDMCHIKL